MYMLGNDRRTQTPDQPGVRSGAPEESAPLASHATPTVNSDLPTSSNDDKNTFNSSTYYEKAASDNTFIVSAIDS